MAINKRAIAEMMDDIQREFDKHSITIPVQADADDIATVTPNVTYNYGPVIQGNADGAQLAWGNQTVTQNQHAEQIAPGFEPVAQAVARTLENLPVVGLAPEEEQDAEDVAREVLAEVVQEEPDTGKIRRAIAALKGMLAPVATGISEGAGEGAQELAKTAIEQLGAALPM